MRLTSQRFQRFSTSKSNGSDLTPIVFFGTSVVRYLARAWPMQPAIRNYFIIDIIIIIIRARILIVVLVKIVVIIFLFFFSRKN